MFLLNSFELIGTIAFAISGAVTGIEKKLDLFGIIFLAVLTAVGGGIFRDLIIGNTPPTAFVNPSAAIISIITALVVFFLYKKIHKFEKIIVISDALGLGVFTAIGCRMAMTHGASNAFFVVAMGLSTGVGGGMIRDVFVGNVPFVLKKEIYAMASIAGALFFYASYPYMPEMVALYFCSAIVFVIRIVAVIHKINLPTRYYEQ
ncbi:MAG: trimeric intracellular cation channel family protein [Acetobacterium sp.]|nr:trimeric intracellular cation channel family protein [uncultured Acetobacterium sp.]MBU4438701.1 trimeric intracellular cation channel family protein [Bacillota bacterium]MCG2729093.1 trimeric intracellular cation channel family protein [Acetobacterium sp.]